MAAVAYNLKKLGLFFADEEYAEISAQLLRNVAPHMAKYGSAYSNWASLMLDEVFGTYEVAITGGDAESYRYLAESIRKHPDQATLKTMLEAAGFARVDVRNLSAGIVAIHRGYKI